ncbi:MAG: cytochrome c3 family protein [Bacteroidota bacterium]|nr:cytochrome c3 family protein [Bacteroidota bacterium]
MNKSFLDYFLKIRLPIIIFVALSSLVLTYYVSRAERDGVGYAPEQPIPFSHALHAGTMGIDCQYCHTGASKSRHAMVPQVNTCMNCHTIARKSMPNIIRLTQYFNENKALPWKRIHKVPDYAYFNHSVHVNKGIACQSCHGNVQEMDVVKQTNSFTMANCLNCHRNAPTLLADVPGIKKGPENCFACHR